MLITMTLTTGLRLISGKDNGTNMLLAVSYLRPFTVISFTTDLLRIRARAEGNDSNIDTDQQTPRSVGCPVPRRPRHHGSTLGGNTRQSDDGDAT